MLAFAGCKKGKQYPTAQAPPTITDPPPKPMKAPMADEDDDLDDDDDAGDDGRDRPSAPGRTSGNVGGQARMVMPRARPTAPAVQTINGHPKGPKAEIFNAVTNTALPNAAPCFAQHAKGGGTVSISVEMTVGTSGSVETAKVTSGANVPALRECIVGVVKRLTFPAFEGPKVTKTIPFTAVRSGP